MLCGLNAIQHDSLRGMIAADVTIAMAALHVLGIVVLREAETAGLTDLGQYAVRRVRGMAQPGDPVLQMRVTIAGVDDPAGVAAAGDTRWLHPRPGTRRHPGDHGVAGFPPPRAQDRRPGIRPCVSG